MCLSVTHQDVSVIQRFSVTQEAHQRQPAEEERCAFEVAFPLEEEVKRAATPDGQGDTAQEQNLRHARPPPRELSISQAGRPQQTLLALV
jgi:hypothetical protein